MPVRGVVYGVAAGLLLLVLGRLPLSGTLLALLPWYVRDLALPVGMAALLSVVRVEGRAFHLAAYALARHACSARRLRGLNRCSAPPPGRRWRTPELVLLADGSDSRLRRLRFSGPGAALIGVAHRCSARERLGGETRLRLNVRSAGAQRRLREARVLKLPAGGRLDVYGG